MKNKNKLITVICGIIGIALIVVGYSFYSKSDANNQTFSNDDYNINNNGGNVAVKVDGYYYVMGKNFFVKMDKDNNIVTNIGKENNISSFANEPFMQIYGDYIYYAVGGYFKTLYRYNYKTNNIELYTEQNDVIAESAIISTYFIRDDKLLYQPYAKDYYYAINLKDNSYEKLKNLEFAATGVIMSYEPNMYKNNIIYEKGDQLNYLDVTKNEIKTVINHECENALIYNNKLYYQYNNGIYKSNLDGTNEALVYEDSFSDLLAVYKDYLYLSKGYSVKVVNINTGEEINTIENCRNSSIAVDKFICTDYIKSTAYSYDLDGSNEKLIYNNK